MQIMNLNLHLTSDDLQPTVIDWQEKAFRATLFTGLIVLVLALFGFVASIAIGAAAWISFMLFAPHKKSPASTELTEQDETAYTPEAPASYWMQQEPSTIVRRATDSKMRNPMRAWVMEVPSTVQE